MRYGLLLFFLAFPLITFADVYQWTDSSGVTHFTDMPVPGSKAVNLSDDAITADRASMNISAPELTQPKEAPSEVAKPKHEANAASKDTKHEIAAKSASNYYSELKIVQPQTEASFFNNRGEVVLTIAAKPSMRKEDKAVILIDGKPMHTAQNDTVLRVENVERGTHSAQVQIQNKTGQVLLESDTITFYMHKGSVNSPANANKPMSLQKPALPLQKPALPLQKAS